MFVSISSEEDNLKFLSQYETGDEIFSLSSGAKIPIRKYFLEFNAWKGAPIPNTYNGKAVIDWNGEPVFAELAVLRLFQAHGWNGAWVDSYRRKFRVGLPDVAEPTSLPRVQTDLIEMLREKTGRFGGCWDVVVWKNDVMRFLELKRLKKDAVQDTQVEWLAAGLDSGLSADNFALVEGDIVPAEATTQ